MIFKETKLKGAFEIEIEKREDERGFFARSFCKKEFDELGLKNGLVQCNLSYNKKKGTLRGMHYQKHPHQEVKLLRCVKGALVDVIIDIRPDSPTYCQWIGVELTEDNFKMLYVPEGFAHGYQTLMDDTVMFYQVSQYYHPESEAGIPWNDSVFKIKWPLSVTSISEKDKNHDNFVLPNVK